MSAPPQPSPEQMAQMRAQFEAEAAKRGMTPQQFQAFQQQEVMKEATKRGMTPAQFQAFQQQEIMREAAKHNITPQQYIQMMQAKAMAEHQRQQAQAQQGQGQGPRPGQQVQQQIPLNGSVEAKPEALALAKFLRKEDLKTRTCILEGIRRDMFRVKRVLRVLQSEKYQKARSKNPFLPEVTNEAQAKNALQSLPLSLLALRVEKVDPHAGHNHAPKKEKRVKGLWTVKVAQQQDFEPDMHYAWIYEESSWKTKIYAGLGLIAVFTIVLFPLWPLFVRQGVWYLSVGAMGLLALFFAMAIVRLILFCLTVFTVPPGFWLYPNLFEDVGFFDSFRPLYGWGDNKKAKQTKTKQAAAGTVQGVNGAAEKAANVVATAAATTTGSKASLSTSGAVLTKRHEAPRVEEVGDDEE